MSVSRLPDGLIDTGSRHLVRNSLINFGGHAVPILAGIAAIPILIAALGTSRFGVLTLAWMGVGYFSLFDLGLGRALTKLVAERVGAQNEPEIPALVGTALGLMLGFSLLGTAAGLFLASWLTQDVLRIPLDLQAESRQAFLLLAASLPIVITSAGLRGLLEARHRFGLVNAIRIPTGVFTFAGPLLVLPFTHSLVAVVGVLVAGRALAWIAQFVLCARAMPEIFRVLRLERRMVRVLLGFGGWMTVTNIVGPVMVYMDRFLIGALLSAAAVAYYATPYEVITKMWLVPGAVLGVLFPAFSAGLRHDPAWVRHTFQRTAQLLLLTLFPATLLIMVFAAEGLGVWLGPEFASRSATVAKWLALGVFINSLAMIPFTLIQGAGRPDITAKLHLAQLGPYLVALWWFTSRYGIEGAAGMWMLRAAVDAVLLFAIGQRFLPQGTRALRDTLAASVIAVLALCLSVLPESMSLKVAYSSLMLLITAVIAWTLTRGTDTFRVPDASRRSTG